MSDSNFLRVKVFPSEEEFLFKGGERLSKVLSRLGVDLPCGGLGICRKCKIQVINGELPISELDQQVFSEAEIKEGWRLACQSILNNNVTIFVPQLTFPVLMDYDNLEHKPQSGYAIAVDLGTTTIVAQLINLRTAKVISTATALNAQSSYGADLISRIKAAVIESHAQTLTSITRIQIKSMINELLDYIPSENYPLVRKVVLAGNTVMHHIFSGLSLDSLSRAPFEPQSREIKCFKGKDLGWNEIQEADVIFLPCLGGFVGSDILAGIIATDLISKPVGTVLIDLGTNGEIVLTKGDELLFCSVAAGPAFEGGRISIGMRACSGAIFAIENVAGKMKFFTIGGLQPIGICGSGLVDLIAVALELGWMNSTGKLLAGKIELIPGKLELTQKDVYELQLAKAAVAAGLEILCKEAGISTPTQIFLAGAFGNYIRAQSAQTIGLVPQCRVISAGNTSLRGIKKIIVQDIKLEELRKLITLSRHIKLEQRHDFHESFIRNLRFSPILPTK